MEKEKLVSDELRVEKALADFVVRYAKEAKTAEEVEALAAVSQALFSLFGLYF